MKHWIALAVLLLFYVSQTYSAIDLSAFELEKITVEIKGEVTNPGIYHVEQDACYEDVIALAGGITKNASLDAINLSKRVVHESVIVIPKIQSTCISLNQASEEELMRLTGVGAATAKRIIAYRTTTPFQTIEDVMKVKGIKEKLFQKIKDDLCL